MGETSVEEIKIVLRDFDPKLDAPLVYSTWRKSAFHSAAIPIPDEAAFFKAFTKKMRTVLKTATVKIACLEDCPTLMVGYVVSTHDHLNWIYVKNDYRKKGIGTLLFPKTIRTVTSDLTKIGLAICEKKKLTVQGDRHE